MVRTEPDAVSLAEVEGFYERYRGIWDDLSLQWLEQRRSDPARQG